MTLTAAQQLALTHAELQIAAILLALEETTGLSIEAARIGKRPEDRFKTTIWLTNKRRN